MFEVWRVNEPIVADDYVAYMLEWDDGWQYNGEYITFGLDQSPQGVWLHGDGTLGPDEQTQERVMVADLPPHIQLKLLQEFENEPL